MARAFSRLERVLDLEAQQGYQNKAVVGGIRQFTLFWVEQAREEAVDEADKAFVEQTSEVLMEYGNLPGVEARQKAADALITSLQKRKERLGDKALPPKKEHRPQPPPKKEPPPKPDKPKQQNDKSTGRRTPLPSYEDDAPEQPPSLTLATPDPEGLAQSVQIIKGVGPKLAETLEKLGASTIWELLYVFPRRYDDYSLMKPIKDLVYGEQVTIIGTIWETRARRVRGTQTLVQSTINDGTGSIQASWFNQEWLADKLEGGYANCHQRQGRSLSGTAGL